MKIGTWFEKILIILATLLFMQVPIFIEQYKQQLTGHVAELHYQIKAIEKAAQNTGKTLFQWINKFKLHDDEDVVSQGHLLDKMLSRLESLNSALTQLKSASPINKIVIFVRHFDGQIGQSTWQSFQPGMAFTLEETVYALMGMIFGSMLFKLFTKIRFKKVSEVYES